MYQFVHIPKTGGCALSGFLKRRHPDLFEEKSHEFCVASSENPIVVVREPTERALSIYNFSVNGSEMFAPEWSLEKNTSFRQFIDTAQSLIDSMIIHTLPQSRWLKPEHYGKTIVVKYRKNLVEGVQGLEGYLGLPRSNYIPKWNVSKNKSQLRLSTYDKEKIFEIYKSDFELWNDLDLSPERFKKVF